MLLVVHMIHALTPQQEFYSKLTTHLVDELLKNYIQSGSLAMTRYVS